VSSSFCFHFVWFRFGAMPAPDHHNHSLALGPIFGVRLTGGVGGLLLAEEITGGTTTAYHFHYDGNGNVTEITDLSGNPTASYRYDAFGNTLSATGTYAQQNRYRFSTKPLDSEVTAPQCSFPSPRRKQELVRHDERVLEPMESIGNAGIGRALEAEDFRPGSHRGVTDRVFVPAAGFQLGGKLVVHIQLPEVDPRVVSESVEIEILAPDQCRRFVFKSHGKVFPETPLRTSVRSPLPTAAMSWKSSLRLAGRPADTWESWFQLLRLATFASCSLIFGNIPPPPADWKSLVATAWIPALAAASESAGSEGGSAIVAFTPWSPVHHARAPLPPFLSAASIIGTFTCSLESDPTVPFPTRGISPTSADFAAASEAIPEDSVTSQPRNSGEGRSGHAEGSLPVSATQDL